MNADYVAEATGLESISFVGLVSRVFSIWFPIQSFIILSVQSDATINQPRNGLGIVVHLALSPLIATMN
jgi:hypothetical protein